MTPLIRNLIGSPFKKRMHEIIARASFCHLFGRRQVRLSPNEGAVTCLVKNGEAYIKTFCEHYLGMGFRHIFLLDNGSTDNTLSIASKWDQVTVFQTPLKVGKYQRPLKKALASRCVSEGWCLDADVDELFDYPYSSSVDLTQLLSYLNDWQYNVLVVQMLDLFADIALAELRHGMSEDIKATYRLFDLSDVREVAYYDSELTKMYGPRNTITEAISLMFGGIRKTLYGINCLLTKHSLFRLGSNVRAFTHVHFADRARIADVTGVVYHYKLIRGAEALAIQNKGAFHATSRGYRDFLLRIESEPNYRIRQDTAEELQRVDQLVDRRFLVVSDAYRRYALDCGKKRQAL